MNTRTCFIALSLLAFASLAMAQDRKPADATLKPMSAPVPAAARIVAKPATDTTGTNGKAATQSTQSQSLRANKKKTGGGQTEDDLYVGVK